MIFVKEIILLWLYMCKKTKINVDFVFFFYVPMKHNLIMLMKIKSTFCNYIFHKRISSCFSCRNISHDYTLIYHSSLNSSFWHSLFCPCYVSYNQSLLSSTDPLSWWGLASMLPLHLLSLQHMHYFIYSSCSYLSYFFFLNTDLSSCDNLCN